MPFTLTECLKSPPVLREAQHTAPPPATAIPSHVLQHVFSTRQQRSTARTEHASKTPEMAGFGGRTPRGSRVTPVLRTWIRKASTLLIMSPKRLPQESPENINTQHWEGGLACLPDTLLTRIIYLFLQSVVFFPLEMSEVASGISTFNSALTC